MKPPDPKTVCLNKWLLFVMNMIQGDHMNRHIHVESEVLHSIYNRLHPEFMYEMKGMFVRSIKRMIKKNKWRDIQVSTEERNKVHSKRQIYFNFLHVNKSDKKHTSQIVISDSNDEYIPIFFNNVGETSSINTKKQPIDPLMTPTTPPTDTLEKSTISVSSPLLGMHHWALNGPRTVNGPQTVYPDAYIIIMYFMANLCKRYDSYIVNE